MELKINKNKYLCNMQDNLTMLRAKLGMTQEQMCYAIGCARQTLISAEKGNSLSWNTFLSLCYLFLKNEETLALIRFLEIYPSELDTLFVSNEEGGTNTLNEVIVR